MRQELSEFTLNTLADITRNRRTGRRRAARNGDERAGIQPAEVRDHERPGAGNERPPAADQPDAQH